MKEKADLEAQTANIRQRKVILMLVTTGLALMILHNNNIDIEKVATTEPVEIPQVNMGELYDSRDLEAINQQIIEFQIQEEARIKAEQEAEARRLEEEARQRALEEEARQRALSKPTFNPYNLREKSNITEEQFYSLLNNTGLNDVAWVFSFCEEYYGINGLFLLGLTALESGWGNSYRAIHHNNLTGYNITSDSVVYTFENRAKSVLMTAKLLANDYLTEGGRYHNGYSIWSVNEKYCANNDWADKIIAISNKLLSELSN